MQKIYNISQNGIFPRLSQNKIFSICHKTEYWQFCHKTEFSQVCHKIEYWQFCHKTEYFLIYSNAECSKFCHEVEYSVCPKAEYSQENIYTSISKHNIHKSEKRRILPRLTERILTIRSYRMIFACLAKGQIFTRRSQTECSQVCLNNIAENQEK